MTRKYQLSKEELGAMFQSILVEKPIFPEFIKDPKVQEALPRLTPPLTAIRHWLLKFPGNGALVSQGRLKDIYDAHFP